MHPRALHSQECFLPPRGGFNLRCTRERYIPKNVFFLREEVLIYDAPSLPRKDNRLTKNFPRSEGRKCGVKGLVQCRNFVGAWDAKCGGERRDSNPGIKIRFI